MTVSSTESRISQACDGITTDFQVPFYFLEASHLVVSLVAPDGTITPWTLGSEYSVNGAGNQSGGEVIAHVAPASGYLIIERIVPPTQETAYQENDPFPAKSHERALDKLTMGQQQVEETLGLRPGAMTRVLRIPASDQGMPTLPMATTRARKALIFDENGNPIASDDDYNDQLANVTQQAQLAQDYKNQAAGSAADAAHSREIVDLTVQNATPRYFTLSGDGVTTVFTIPYSVSNKGGLDIYIGGEYLGKANFDVSGTQLTFASPPPVGTNNIEGTVGASVALVSGDTAGLNFSRGDTGALTRTLADKVKETLSARDYVSPVWAAAIQTIALQQMINNVGAHGEFVFPWNSSNGEWLLSDSLLFDDYQRFTSRGAVPTIKMVGGAKACFKPRKTGARTEQVEFNGLTISNSNIDLWTNESTIGLDLREVSHFVLRRLRIRDHSRAIVHGGTTPGILGGYYNAIEDCEIANNKIGIDAIDNANSTVVVGGRIHSNREGFRGANLTDYTFLAAFERNRIGIHCLSGAQGVNAPSGRFEGNNRNQVITNIVVAAGVATVNSARHWLVDGDEVIVTVSAEPLLNGIKTVSAAGPNAYQLDATGVADGTYSGTGATIVLPAGGAAVYEVGAFRNSIGGCHFSSGADQVIDKDGRNFFISSGGGTRPTSGLSSNNIAGNPKFRVDSNADGLADGWSVESAPPSAGFTLALDTSVKRGGVNSQRLTVSTSGTVRKSVFRHFRVTPGIPWIFVIDFRTDTALPWNLRIGNALNGTDYVNTPLSYKGALFSQVPTYFVPTQEDIVVTLFMNTSTAGAGSASKNLWIDSISLSPGTVAPTTGAEPRIALASFPNAGRPVRPEPWEVIHDQTVGPIYWDPVAAIWRTFGPAGAVQAAAVANAGASDGATLQAKINELLGALRTSGQMAP